MSEEFQGYFPGLQGGWLHGKLFRGLGLVSGGILVIPPFGEERKNTLRPAVELGRALASRGVAVFLFDFSGYGDSSEETTPAEWERWQAEAAIALAFVRQETGCQDWTLLGLRLGSLTALALAQQGLGQRLILVDPPTSGPNAWRELQFRLQIREALGTGKAGEEADGQDIGGYGVAKGWPEALAAFDLAAAVGAARIPVHCLHPGPIGSGSWPTLKEALAQQGGSARPWNGKPIWRLGDTADGSTLIARTSEILGIPLDSTIPAAGDPT